MSFLSEIKRRNVVKVGVAYAIIAWLVLQIIDVVLPAFDAPEWIMRVVILFLSLGFVISLFVAWAFELTPEGMRPTHKVNVEESITPQTGQKLNNIIIGVLSLAVVFLVVDNYILEDDAGSTESAEAEADVDSDSDEFEISATADLETSIAVLPFANLSSDPEQEYFSDGLTEEILNKLAQVKDLQVAGRTSSFYFKGRNEDLRDIAEQLGVNFILEGSVRSAGDDLRITAQLIQAENGFHLWSDTFDRAMEDIFAIQDEIAEAVATALRVTLGTDEFALPGSTRNVEAYQHYLQGWALANQGTEESDNRFLQSSLEEYIQATTLDPNYARAWFWVYQIYGAQSGLVPPDEGVEYASRSAEALERATALAPEMPELQLENVFNAETFQESEQIILELIEQGGINLPEVHRVYANFLLNVGKIQQALNHAEQANRLNPMDLFVHIPLASILTRLGRLDEAQQTVDRAYGFIGDGGGALLPAMEWGIAFERGGKEAWAEGMISFYEDFDGGLVGAFNRRMAEILLIQDEEQASEAIRDIFFDPQTPSFLKTTTPMYSAMVGDAEQALEMMNINGGISPGVWASYGSELRQLPGFKEMLEEYGFVDYWRTTGWGDYCRPLEGNDDFECF